MSLLLTFYAQIQQNVAQLMLTEAEDLEFFLFSVKNKMICLKVRRQIRQVYLKLSGNQFNFHIKKHDTKTKQINQNEDYLLKRQKCELIIEQLNDKGEVITIVEMSIYYYWSLPLLTRASQQKRRTIFENCELVSS